MCEHCRKERPTHGAGLDQKYGSKFNCYRGGDRPVWRRIHKNIRKRNLHNRKVVVEQ